LTLYLIPMCHCYHPLDAHDVKTNACILHGCGCEGFVPSGQVQKREAS
jgi:hypothetical protein